MLIRLIREHAEAAFIEALESYHHKLGSRGVLLCRFSIAAKPASPEEILAAVKDVLADHEGELFFCANHDVLIVWHGSLGGTVNSLKNILAIAFGPSLAGVAPQEFFHFYDSHVNGEDLRLQFMGRLQESSPSPIPPIITLAAPVQKIMPAFTPQQLQLLQAAMAQRRQRKSPEILIVEDQDFSRRLLVGMLEQHYKCHWARDGAQALEIYAAHAPSIVFLDIELPDMNGHDMAVLFKKHDPKSFVVMVTANNYVRDVEAARNNKVQGFIAKPYSKQKIQGAVDAYVSNYGTGG